MHCFADSWRVESPVEKVAGDSCDESSVLVNEIDKGISNVGHGPFIQRDVQEVEFTSQAQSVHKLRDFFDPVNPSTRRFAGFWLGFAGIYLLKHAQSKPHYNNT